METRWIENIADFEPWAPAWDQALLASKEDNPFVHSDFIRTWWKHYGTGRRLRLFMVRQGDRVLGGIPLFEDQPGRWEQIGRNAANYTEFLLAPGQTQLWDPFLKALSEKSGWKQVTLKRIRKDRLRLPDARLRKGSKLLLNAPETELTYLIELPSDFSRFPKQLHPKLWQLVRQARNKANRIGPMKLELVQTPEALQQFMEQLITFSKKGFRDRGMRSNFEEEVFSRFFTELVQQFFAKGFLQAYTLRAGDQLLALSFCYSLTNNCNCIQSAYNPAMARFRLGHLMYYKMAEESSRLGKPILDLATGRYQYKEHFTRRRDPIHTVEIRPGSLAGLAGHAASAVRWRLRSEIHARPKLHRWLQKVRGVRIN
jgi:CelD/BcsL family acetyltransferase involved in cellulose biosynthesis